VSAGSVGQYELKPIGTIPTWRLCKFLRGRWRCAPFRVATGAFDSDPTAAWRCPNAALAAEIGSKLRGPLAVIGIIVGGRAIEGVPSARHWKRLKKTLDPTGAAPLRTGLQHGNRAADGGRASTAPSAGWQRARADTPP